MGLKTKVYREDEGTFAVAKGAVEEIVALAWHLTHRGHFSLEVPDAGLLRVQPGRESDIPLVECLSKLEQVDIQEVQVDDEEE